MIRLWWHYRPNGTTVRGAVTLTDERALEWIQRGIKIKPVTPIKQGE